MAEWPGSFMCHCGNTGVELTPNKSQHTKLTLENKILLPLLPGFELATFRSQFGALTNKLCRLHVIKQLSPDPADFPWCNAAMGGDKLIRAKHVACHVNKHRLDSRKENMLSLLTGLGKRYCCILLPQIRPECKVLSCQIAFCAHKTRIQNVSVAWRHSL